MINKVVSLLVFVAVVTIPSNAEKSKDTKINPSCLRYLSFTISQSRLYDMQDYFDIFMGQIEQESRCNENITAFDHGMGLAQFMPKTAKWIHEEFPEELSAISETPNPYNPKWAIRAMILYDRYLLDRVSCQGDWHFALRAYNGGLGNINKEIKLANSCDYELVASFCKRSEFSCKINTSYPYNVFKRSLKYNLYIGDKKVDNMVGD